MPVNRHEKRTQGHRGQRTEALPGNQRPVQLILVILLVLVIGALVCAVLLKLGSLGGAEPPLSMDLVALFGLSSSPGRRPGRHSRSLDTR